MSADTIISLITVVFSAIAASAGLHAVVLTQQMRAEDALRRLLEPVIAIHTAARAFVASFESAKIGVADSRLDVARVQLEQALAYRGIPDDLSAQLHALIGAPLMNGDQAGALLDAVTAAKARLAAERPAPPPFLVRLMIEPFRAVAAARSP